MAELALVVVAHRDVDAVLVLDLLLALDERFVLEIEPVFQEALLEELRDVVQRDMHQHRPDNRSRHIEPQVHPDGIDVRSHRMAEKPDGQDDYREARHQRIKDHLPRIELQLLLVPGTDAGDADEKERRNLTPDEIAVVVDEPAFHSAVDVREDASPEIQHARIDCIEEELHEQRHVDEAPEDLVSDNEVPTFLHFSSCISE